MAKMSRSDKSIFSQIVDGEQKRTFIYDDEHCIAFNDDFPKAPTHFLVNHVSIVANVYSTQLRLFRESPLR